MSERTMRNATLWLLGGLALAAALAVGLTFGRGRDAASIAGNGVVVPDSAIATAAPAGPTRNPLVSDYANTALAITSGTREALRTMPTFTPEPRLIGTELPPDIDASVPRLPLAEAAARYGDPDVLFVDVRSGPEYRLEHVAGAVHIPVAEMSRFLDTLPADRDLIFYCACAAEHTSAIAAYAAIEAGFERSFAMVDGWYGWVDEGMPTSRGEEPGAVEAASGSDGLEEGGGESESAEGADQGGTP